MKNIRIHIASCAGAGRSTVLALVEDYLLKAGLDVRVAVDRDVGEQTPAERMERANKALAGLAGNATVMLSEVQLRRVPMKPDAA